MGCAWIPIMGLGWGPAPGVPTVGTAVATPLQMRSRFLAVAVIVLSFFPKWKCWEKHGKTEKPERFKGKYEPYMAENNTCFQMEYSTYMYCICRYCGLPSINCFPYMTGRCSLYCKLR